MLNFLLGFLLGGFSLPLLYYFYKKTVKKITENLKDELYEKLMNEEMEENENAKNKDYSDNRG